MQINESMMEHKFYEDFPMKTHNSTGRPCMMCFCPKMCPMMCPMMNCGPMVTMHKCNKTKEPEKFSIKNITIKAVDIDELKD